MPTTVATLWPVWDRRGGLSGPNAHPERPNATPIMPQRRAKCVVKGTPVEVVHSVPSSPRHRPRATRQGERQEARQRGSEGAHEVVAGEGEGEGEGGLRPRRGAALAPPGLYSRLPPLVATLQHELGCFNAARSPLLRFFCLFHTVLASFTTVLDYYTAARTYVSRSKEFPRCSKWEDSVAGLDRLRLRP